jgi:hypothetical protein
MEVDVMTTPVDDSRYWQGHDDGWHAALSNLREQVLDQIKRGQSITREDLLHAIDLTDE